MEPGHGHEPQCTPHTAVPAAHAASLTDPAVQAWAVVTRLQGCRPGEAILPLAPAGRGRIGAAASQGLPGAMKGHLKNSQHRTVAAGLTRTQPPRCAAISRMGSTARACTWQVAKESQWVGRPGGRSWPGVLCRKVVLVDGLDLSGANFQSEVTVSLLMVSFFITSQVKNFVKIFIRTRSPTPMSSAGVRPPHSRATGQISAASCVHGSVATRHRAAGTKDK